MTALGTALLAPRADDPGLVTEYEVVGGGDPPAEPHRFLNVAGEPYPIG